MDIVSSYRRLFAPGTLCLGHSCALSPLGWFFRDSGDRRHLSDRTRFQCTLALIPIFTAAVGYATLLAIHTSLDVQYGVLFLSTVGSFAAVPMVVWWFGLNREMEFRILPQMNV